MLEFLIAVHIDFVGASLHLSIDVAAVDHHEPAVIGGFNMRVMAGGPWIVEHDLIVGRAPNGAGRAWIQLVFRLVAAGVGDLLENPRSSLKAVNKSLENLRTCPFRGVTSLLLR